MLCSGIELEFQLHNDSQFGSFLYFMTCISSRSAANENPPLTNADWAYNWNQSDFSGSEPSTFGMEILSTTSRPLQAGNQGGKPSDIKV